MSVSRSACLTVQICHMYVFRCIHLFVCCVACYTSLGPGVKPSRTVPVKMENSPSFHSSLFLNSFSCTPSTRFIPAFRLIQNTSPSTLLDMPALYQKIFSAEVWVNLIRNGKKCISLVATFKSYTATSCPHFLSFFPPLSSCSDCPFFILFFFKFLFSLTPHLSSSPSAPYGATACVNSPLGPFCTAA